MADILIFFQKHQFTSNVYAGQCCSDKRKNKQKNNKVLLGLIFKWSNCKSRTVCFDLLLPELTSKTKETKQFILKYFSWFKQ